MHHLGTLRRMQLLPYLKLKKISVPQFAVAIGEDESIARKWVYRQRQPSLPSAVLIEDWSGGEVPPRDMIMPGKRKIVPDAASAAQG